jgi:Lysylphosphatidylglycerol synthase TM region
VPLDSQRAARDAPAPDVSARRRANITGVASAAIGLALFAWFVSSIGAAVIWDGLRAVGLGLIVIIVLAGLRFALRALAWTRAVEPPATLPFLPAFAAVLAGDAIGNLTPLGLIVGEPAKAAFIRDRLPLAASLPALAIENIFYTLSVAAMIAASTVALLLTFTLPGEVQHAAWFAVAAIFGGFVVVALMLWRQPSFVSQIAARLVPSSSRLHARLDRLREVEQQIYTFATRRRHAILPIVAAEIGFHALGVLEAWLTWWFMQGVPPPLLLAFILEGANRLIIVLFKFVPLQLGVAEWTSGSFTQILGYGAAIGGTMSIVRKVRVVFWVLVGTSLMIRRGFGFRRQSG